MADLRIFDRSARIADFAKDDLDELVETLSTKYPSLKVTDVAVISALVMAARRSPHEATAAYLESYWEHARDVRNSIEAIGAFLAAFGS